MEPESHEGASPAKALQKARRGWGFAVVTGRSMLPTLSPGDRLLVRYGRIPRSGDLVVAEFVDGTVAVKRAARPQATRTGAPGWWLLSDNPEEGVDSRHRGPVAESQVWGVVQSRVWPRPHRGSTLARRS